MDEYIFGVPTQKIGMNCPWSSFEPSRFIYCEEQLCSWVVNPADTWTNLAYFLVAFFIIRKASAPSIVTKLFAVTSVIAGLGSIAFHATITQWGAYVDMYGMIVVSMLVFSLAMQRLLDWTDRTTTIFYITGFLISATYPLWFATGKPFFGGQLLAATGIEYYLIRKGKSALNLGLLTYSIVLFLVALAFNLLDYFHVLCWPSNHIFTGHGAWHFICAAALYSLYLAYGNLVSNRLK